jgi:hypothetical protein
MAEGSGHKPSIRLSAALVAFSARSLPVEGLCGHAAPVNVSRESLRSALTIDYG